MGHNKFFLVEERQREKEERVKKKKCKEKEQYNILDMRKKYLKPKYLN